MLQSCAVLRPTIRLCPVVRNRSILLGDLHSRVGLPWAAPRMDEEAAYPDSRQRPVALMRRLTRTTLVTGVSSIVVRFVWIQGFRFWVLHRIEQTPGGWEVSGIWVGGPLGWQHGVLQFLLYSGTLSLVAAVAFLCRDLSAGALKLGERGHS